MKLLFDKIYRDFKSVQNDLKVVNLKMEIIKKTLDDAYKLFKLTHIGKNSYIPAKLTKNPK